MNLEPTELLSQVKMADNERLALRLQLEGEARRATRREEPQLKQPRRFRIPWMLGHRHVSAT